MARFTGLVCLLLVGPSLWAQSAIRLRTRDLHAAGQRPAANRLARGGHFILGFPSYPDRDVRAGLTARGILVLQYVPDSALMVSVPRGASLEGLNLTFAVAMEAGEKIDPALAESSTNAYLAIFHADIAPARTREIARGAGFDVLDHPSLLANQLVTIGSFDRLRGLAANDEVQYIMPASADLIAGAPLVACPGGITEAGPIGEYVLVGRGWSKDASGVAGLHYFVQDVTEKAEPNSVYIEIERALREWTRFANITLTPTDRADALRTIAIRFARGAHGDDYAFDGAGKTLGHTFYPAPPNSEPAAGDLHLDADEDWQVGGAIDIFSVVLHEMGHALGLGHSTQPGAVMYPYFRMATGLAADDIAGIQDMYGAPAAPSQAPPGPAGPPLQPPATPAGPPVTPTAPTGPTEPPLQPPTTPTLPPATPAVPTGPAQPPLLPPTVPALPPATPVLPPVTTPVPPPATTPVQPPVTTPVPPPATTPVQPPATTPVEPPATPTEPPAAAPAAKDTTAPSLRIASPGTTIVSTSFATISMSGTASDAVGVASVKWTTSAGTTGTASGTTAWSVNIPLLVGTNAISIRAFDDAGNSSRRAVTVVRR